MYVTPTLERAKKTPELGCRTYGGRSPIFSQVSVRLFYTTYRKENNRLRLQKQQWQDPKTSSSARHTSSCPAKVTPTPAPTRNEPGTPGRNEAPQALRNCNTGCNTRRADYRWKLAVTTMLQATDNSIHVPSELTVITVHASNRWTPTAASSLPRVRELRYPLGKATVPGERLRTIVHVPAWTP